jgi:hypothetical protein
MRNHAGLRWSDFASDRPEELLPEGE